MIRKCPFVLVKEHLQKIRVIVAGTVPGARVSLRFQYPNEGVFGMLNEHGEELFGIGYSVQNGLELSIVAKGEPSSIYGTPIPQHADRFYSDLHNALGLRK